MVKQIGDFRLMERIGQGAYAKVRKAIHIPTRQLYAVKIMNRDCFIDQQESQQVQREIEIMSQMHHPGLIALYTVLETPDRWYIVLEYASGGELFDALTAHGPFNEDTAWDYFHQLVDAINYMHSNRAVHRDIKPENLLLDGQKRLKVADFGLSIIANSQNGQLNTKCGTPEYAAPELFGPDVYVGQPADIWSMGVILYVMLTAQLPFRGTTVEEIAKSVLYCQVQYPAIIPQGAVELLQKIFVVDPSKRYTMQQIRDDPWFQNKDHQTVVQPDSRIETSVHSQKHEELIERWKMGVECYPTAFELIARLRASPGILAFTANRSKLDAIRMMETVFEMNGSSVIEVRDIHTAIVLSQTKTETIVLRIDVLSIHGLKVIIIGCPIQGSKGAFHRFFASVKLCVMYFV
jgi:serine/threonine protein kinase